MEQIKIAETLKENNAKTTANFAVIMAIMFVTVFVVTVVPVAPTLIILAAPALLMNVGWILFAGLR